MDHLSDDSPIDGWDRGNPERRCTAHKKTGERCKRWAIRGGTVCTHHGGSSGPVRARARRRLEDAADRLAKQLLGIAEGAESEQVRLSAVKDALDRAGLKPPTQVDVQVGPKPWENLVESIVPMTRAESRAQRGMPDLTPRFAPQRALPATAEPYVVDAEVVDPPARPVDEVPTPAWGNGATELPQAGTGLMTLEEANAALREAQRRHNGA